MFEVGDKLVCIDDSPGMGRNSMNGKKLPIEKGKIYVVRRTAFNKGPSGPKQVLQLVGIDMGISEFGVEFGFWCSRFKKLISRAEKQEAEASAGF